MLSDSEKIKQLVIELQELYPSISSPDAVRLAMNLLLSSDDMAQLIKHSVYKEILGFYSHQFTS